VKHRPISLALASALLAACGSSSDNDRPTGLGPAQSGKLAVACASLTSAFTFANTTIASAVDVPAGTLMLAGGPVAAHCLVRGGMFKRTTSDARNWEIGFEMRMPVDWNGRYYYQANGGLDGNVVTAVGATGAGPLTHALLQGFAVISSDAGHTGAQTTQFGFDPQARLDYGYQAVGKLTPMAKELVKAAYGRGPDRSYIGGCSNGGRHVMVAAARYPEMYDGFLAGAPGYNLPRAAVANMWGMQQFGAQMTAGATIVNGTATIPDVSTAFTVAERQLVASRIQSRCDALDGAVDGIVQDTIKCQSTFDLANDVPTCTGARDGKCLTAAQKLMVKATFDGAKTTTGAAIYRNFYFDPALAAANWALWKYVNSFALDPLAVGTVFGTPPAFVPAPLTANIDQLYAGISATNATYAESGLSFMTPPNASNIKTLRDKNAKMMVYHGVADAIFSAADTVAWYDALPADTGGTPQDYARLFLVPGMNHCGGGYATDQFDMLSNLVNWVEYGTAPERVFAGVRGAGNPGGVNAEIPADWSATRSRPLCPYPKVARYLGTGSTEDQLNFACQ
jgi:hypothetical protein